jgi:hypothetical protein
VSDSFDRVRFFDHLYACCEGILELRIIKDNRVNQHFFELIDHKSINQCIEHYRDHNIFFGFGTRDASGNGRKENVVNIPALWTDVDFKDIEKAEVKNRLDTFPFKPTASVLSGHGVHFYWMLREAAERGEIDLIEDLLRRIAHHFNGDSSACELARVLRVPGTMNAKKESIPVKLHFLEDFTYNLEDFDILPTTNEKKPNGDGLSTNPSGWMVEAFKGVPEHGNDNFLGRDAAGIKLAGYWIERLDQQEVFKILQCWNMRNTPPLADADLRRIVSSSCRYASGTKPKQGTVYDWGF